MDSNPVVIADPAGQYVVVSNQVSRAAVLFTTEDTPAAAGSSQLSSGV